LDKADRLADLLNREGVTGYVREHRFHGTRKWRFDFAWPQHLVAVEVEGGTWVGGRHTRGSGFAKDCEKYNEAACLGWRLVRVTPGHFKTGQAVKWVTRALDKERNGTASQS